MDKGYIKIWRKIEDNKFLCHDNNAYVVFTKLLTYCNYKTGEYDTGRFVLAELTNLNPSTLYKVLIRLEDNRLVTLKSNNKYTTISICNWTKYQSDSNTSDEQPGNNAVTTREQPGNTKQELNIKHKTLNTYVRSDEPTTRTYKTLFTELVTILGHSPATLLSTGRLTKLKVRNKTFKYEELISSAQALAADGYMMGDNDAGKKYGTIDYLLRSDENVDKYLNGAQTVSSTSKQAVKEVFDESKYV